MAKNSATSVDALLDAIAHPRRDDIERLRGLLRGLDPRVQESWKWNAPNFALDGDFATFRLQPKHAFQLILHAGAARGALACRPELSAPAGLLTWPGTDRCVVALDRLPAGASGDALLLELVTAWLRGIGRL